MPMIVPYTQTSGHLGYSVRSSHFRKDCEQTIRFKNEKFTNILLFSYNKNPLSNQMN